MPPPFNDALSQLSGRTELGDLFLTFAAFVWRYRARALASLADGQQFDGLAFWQPWKKLFSSSAREFRIQGVTNPQLIQFEQEHSDYEQLPEIGETWHFLLQLYRLGSHTLERDDKSIARNCLSVVKLMQYALNYGQFRSSPYSIGEYVLPEITQILSERDYQTELKDVFSKDVIKMLREQFRKHLSGDDDLGYMKAN